MGRARLFGWIIITTVVLYAPAFADGYRPESPFENDFVATLNSAEIAVLTTIFRSAEGDGYSTASRQRIVDHLNAQDFASATAIEVEPRLKTPFRMPQFDLFMDSLGEIGQQVAAQDIGADYAMVLEVVLRPVVDNRIAVFGIHVFILTPDGENAFSFLLNSHHASFNAASLYSLGTSPAAREELVLRSTAVALRALEDQIAVARECAPKPGLDPETSAGVAKIEDFEFDLPAGRDSNGIAVGFSTFAGRGSRVWLSITDGHPSRPNEAPGNHVLQIDLDVDSWAGVLHRFENSAKDQWVSYNFHRARELSFWLHGNHSGTTLVVDVLDNRRGCSMNDNAERYSYEFPDDFAGWRLISIPFEVMTRKDIGNDAPDDGLGLSSVNGWGFAALKSHGPKTFFIDDVRVRYAPILETEPAGAFRETLIWCPTNELPMFGAFEKTASQHEADKKFVNMAVASTGGDRTAAAEKFARMGWNFYSRGDKAKAIKRFNQAWLLDADNQHALWGFAVISRERGKRDEAIRFYEMALEGGSGPDKLVEEYEELMRSRR